MVCFEIFRPFKTAFSLYIDRFVSIFSVSFFYSVLTTIFLVGLLWIPFSWEELFTVDVDQSLNLVFKQLSIFPVSSLWIMSILKLVQLSPWLVIVLMVGIIAFINILALGFTKVLLMIYNQQQVYIKDIFPSFILIKRVFLGLGFFLCGALLMGIGMWAFETYFPVYDEDLTSFISLIYGTIIVLSSLWLIPFALCIFFGLIDTDVAFINVLKDAWDMTRKHILRFIIFIVIFACVIGIFFYVEERIVGIAYTWLGLTYSVMVKTFLQKMITLPYITFVLFDFYRTLGHETVMKQDFLTSL